METTTDKDKCHLERGQQGVFEPHYSQTKSVLQRSGKGVCDYLSFATDEAQGRTLCTIRCTHQQDFRSLCFRRTWRKRCQ